MLIEEAPAVQIKPGRILHSRLRQQHRISGHRAGKPPMYGMNARGLPGTLAPIYQELQVERSEAPATSRTCATQFSSASACASMRLSPFSRRYQMQSATHLRFEFGADRAILIYEAMVRASPAFLAHKCQEQSNSSSPHKPEHSYFLTSLGCVLDQCRFLGSYLITLAKKPLRRYQMKKPILRGQNGF